MPEVLGTDPGDGIIGMGTTLEGEDTGAIGMITRLAIAGVEVDEVDVTTMNSPNRYKKFIAGLKDARDLTADLIYEARNAKVVLDAVGGDNEDWTITFPDDCTYEINGYIKNVGAAIPFNDKITQTVQFRLSGPPTFTLGSGITP